MKFEDIKHKRAVFIAAGWLLILIFAALDTGLAFPEYKIFTGKVNSPVRIVLLSDLHSSSYGEDQEVLIKAVESRSPDVILLTGDIADDIRPHTNTVELLSVLGKEFPCFYVTGNHEEWSGEEEKIKEIIRSCNVKVLEGDAVPFEANGETVRICGVDNSMPGEQFADCCKAVEDDIFTVLMSHRPDHVDLYSGKGFDLVVSGHAHGGQVIIPHILNGLYAPDQGLFPEYAGGEYILDDGMTTMIVSRGLCKNILPRVFDRPEVVVIDIMPEDT